MTTSKSITDKNFEGNKEVLDSKVASSFTKIINRDLERKFHRREKLDGEMSDSSLVGKLLG